MIDMTGPVTIYKNNQLGISINVEEHEEEEDNFEDEIAGGRFSKPLRRLTAKSVPFSWTEDCQTSFERITRSKNITKHKTHEMSMLTNLLICKQFWNIREHI